MKKRVVIEEVENGFTVRTNYMSDMGYEEHKEHVAETHTKAMKLAKEYLEPDEE